MERSQLGHARVEGNDDERNQVEPNQVERDQVEHNQVGNKHESYSTLLTTLLGCRYMPACQP
jgi:hypothetical protein